MDSSNELKYKLTDSSSSVLVAVSDPTEVKSTLLSYTIYKINGCDRQGEFNTTKRYSDFDHLRASLLKHWPGCFIPPLPRKKLMGNSDADFIEVRKQGLNYFCHQLSKLEHLWYSEQLQIFLRKNGDVDANLKAIPAQNPEDIIKKYDAKLPRLSGYSIDTMVIAKVLDFSKYLKKIQPIISNFKTMMEGFLEVQRTNMQQYSLLYNFILPEYERSCLSIFLNKNSQGKMVFSEENDEKLGHLINKMKQILKKKNFQQLYQMLDLQERQIQAFLEVFKNHQGIESKLSDMRKKEKDLEIEQQQLNAGKQSIFKSFFKKGNIEVSKKQIEAQISSTKDIITTYSLLSDLITIILGHFEINRFRADKYEIYQSTLRQIGKIQSEISKVQSQISNHILDNHNLM